jgi:hypothetical protein
MRSSVLRTTNAGFATSGKSSSPHDTEQRQRSAYRMDVRKAVGKIRRPFEILGKILISDF